MIDIIKKNKSLENLVHIKRFSNVLTLVDESVSDHVFKMNCLALSIVPEINKRIVSHNEPYQFSNKADWFSLIFPLDLKEVIYKVTVHDLDECVTMDLNRKIKYHNEEITKAFHNTTQSILKEHFDSDFIYDINNAKNSLTREGYLVSVLDALQAGLKMQEEIELGNKFFKKEINNVIENFQERLEDLPYKDFDYIFKESIKELMNDYIIEFKTISE